MKTIGFIGLGNMAEAIISGLISSGNFSSDEIGAFRRDENKLKQSAEKLGIKAFESNEELVKNCKCIVLSVKPNALQEVLKPLKEIICKVNPLVISIAAGQSIEKLQSLIGLDAAVVRVMPNINAIAGKSVSGYAVSSEVSREQENFAVKFLKSFGDCVSVSEENFSAFSAIAGCSPAYAYLFFDAIARVGVKYGLTKKDALEIVSSAVIDSASADKKIDENKLDAVVLNAIIAAYNKDKGMGK